MVKVCLKIHICLIIRHGGSTCTGGKRPYGPGSCGPLVSVAEPGSITRDQYRSRFQHEPGPIGLHLGARSEEGVDHWSRFVARTGIVDLCILGYFCTAVGFCIFFIYLFGVFCIQFNGTTYIH
jgi:hypothetical protein